MPDNNNDLNKRLKDFSKTKAPKQSNQFTVAVDLENKEKFNLTKKQYNLTSNELMKILLEGVDNAR
jgi:hypothetical protein